MLLMIAYEGKFSNGRKYGTGIFYSKNGDQFEIKADDMKIDRKSPVLLLIEIVNKKLNQLIM